MEKKLSLLLVEDDPTTCKEFIGLVENSTQFELVGVTNNALKAIDIVKDYLPDIVILDLELHLGLGSGLDVLSGIKSLALTKIPYFLVTTNNSSAVTYESTRLLGADYIMSKHEQDYSEQKVLSFLEMISTAIKSKKKIPATDELFDESPVYQKKHIIRRITSELNLVGINPKSIGYRYLIDAILITIKEPQQNLCVVIANKYGKTESSVERAMQNAINRAWTTSDINDLLTCYTAKTSSSKGVPTLTEFIFYYANKIKLEY